MKNPTLTIAIFCLIFVAFAPAHAETQADKGGEGATTQQADNGAQGAATKQAAISPEKKALILQLLKITDADKNVKAIADAIIRNHEKQYPALMTRVIEQDAKLTDGQKKVLIAKIDTSAERSGTRLRQIFDEKVNMADILNKVAINVYDKYFTDAELTDIITFYESPTGKKSMQVMPQVMQESMEQSSKLLLPQMEEVLLQFIKEEHDRLVGAPEES